MTREELLEEIDSANQAIDTLYQDIDYWFEEIANLELELKGSE